MAPVTRSNIHQHELIGLPAAVASSTNPSQVGISGRVVDETMNTVTISNGLRDRIVQKKGASFDVMLPEGTTITVEGDKIRGRPVERVKARAGDS